jgi:hypothetical protein
MALASSLKPRGRSLHPSTCSPESDSRGRVSIRRAIERPIPVVATTRSRISHFVRLCSLGVLDLQFVRHLPTCGHVDLAFRIGQACRASRSNYLRHTTGTRSN